MMGDSSSDSNNFDIGSLMAGLANMTKEDLGELADRM